MQRRAAAVYFALFVLIGAGSYAFLQVGMSQPHVDLPPEDLQSGDTIEVDGQQFTVSEIQHGSGDGDGDHGGGGGAETNGTLTFTNESFVATASLDHNGTTTYEGTEVRVAIENGSDVSSFDLVETQNLTAILDADSALENETVTRNNATYVVYRDNRSIQRLSEYLTEPATVATVSEGETLSYQAEEETVNAEVVSVTPDGASLQWNSPREEEIELTDGSNITLNGEEHFVHFTGEESVEVLPIDEYYAEFQAQQEEKVFWFERHAGLWAVVLLSFLVAIILASTAYLPVKG